MKKEIKDLTLHEVAIVCKECDKAGREYKCPFISVVIVNCDTDINDKIRRLNFDKKIELSFTPLENVNTFNRRIYNILRRNGYKYLEELKDFTYDELIKMRNMGHKSACIVTEEIQKRFYNNFYNFE